MAYLLSGTLFLISIFNIDTPKGKEHLLCKWSLLMGLAVLIMGYKIYKKYHWSLGICFAYFGCLAIYTFQWPYNNYFGYHNTIKIVINNSAALAFISLICVYFIIEKLKLEDLVKMKPFFIIITLLNSAIVLTQYLKGNNWYLRGGLFDNVSINGCIIGACYPLLLESNFIDRMLLKKIKFTELKILLRGIILLLPILAIMCAMSSVAVGVLAVGVAAYSYAWIKNIVLKILVPISLFIGIMLFGYASNPKEMFKDSKRFELFRIQYNNWNELGQHAFGYGTGSYLYFGVKTQVENKFMISKRNGRYEGSYNLWLHSDWIQLLLEGGIIGILLILNIAFFLVFKSWNNPAIFACLLAYMSSMLFHYPIHYPIHALFGSWLIAYIMLNNKQKKGDENEQRIGTREKVLCV